MVEWFESAPAHFGLNRVSQVGTIHFLGDRKYDEIDEVDARQSPKVLECPVEGESRSIEVDIFGRTSRRHPGEHPGAALEQPLGALALGEDAAQESAKVLVSDALADGD